MSVLGFQAEAVFLQRRTKEKLRSKLDEKAMVVQEEIDDDQIFSRSATSNCTETLRSHGSQSHTLFCLAHCHTWSIWICFFDVWYFFALYLNAPLKRIHIFESAAWRTYQGWRNCRHRFPVRFQGPRGPGHSTPKAGPALQHVRFSKMKPGPYCATNTGPSDTTCRNCYDRMLWCYAIAGPTYGRRQLAAHKKVRMYIRHVCVYIYIHTYIMYVYICMYILYISIHSVYRHSMDKVGCQILALLGNRAPWLGNCYFSMLLQRSMTGNNHDPVHLKFWISEVNTSDH